MDKAKQTGQKEAGRTRLSGNQNLVTPLVDNWKLVLSITEKKDNQNDKD